MLLWVVFPAVIVLLLLIDLGVWNRGARVIHPKEAFAWTIFWVALAQVFNALVYVLYESGHWGRVLSLDPDLGGGRAAFQFLTAYLLEKCLSLDNIFVIALILAYFRIPSRFQHRVLFWGIAGAMVMRGIMISVGVYLVDYFGWVTYVFGALLLVTSLAMLVRRPTTAGSAQYGWLVRLANRFYPTTSELESGKFFVRKGGVSHATPLLLVLILIELTDLVFAVDSVPVFMAVTEEPFIVFSANVFALLGLRSLYFAFAGLLGMFRYLQVSFLVILVFIGIKMLLFHHVPIPLGLTVLIILGIIAAGIVYSIVRAAQDKTTDFILFELDPKALASLNQRQAKRIIALVMGTTLMLIGTAMLVLPGPGLLVIGGGLAALSSEVLWARRLLNKVRRVLNKEAQEGIGETGEAAPSVRKGLAARCLGRPWVQRVLDRVRRVLGEEEPEKPEEIDRMEKTDEQ